MLKTINMKKVIRLTEYDLTRIVKRVLKEESEVIKIKAWDNLTNSLNGGSRSQYNFDTTNHTLKNNRVFFNAQIVGTDGKNDQGTLSRGILSCRCGSTANYLNVENSSLGTHMEGGKLVPLNYLYVTPEAIKRLTKKCD